MEWNEKGESYGKQGQKVIGTWSTLHVETRESLEKTQSENYVAGGEKSRDGKGSRGSPCEEHRKREQTGSESIIGSRRRGRQDGFWGEMDEVCMGQMELVAEPTQQGCQKWGGEVKATRKYWKREMFKWKVVENERRRNAGHQKRPSYFRKKESDY